MNVFTIAANAVLVALTLFVIVFAKRTVTESRKATKAARDTVSALETLLGYSGHGDVLGVSRGGGA